MPDEGQDIKTLDVEYAHRDGLFRPAGAIDDVHILGFKLVYNHSPAGFRGNAPVTIQGSRWLVEDNHIRWSSYNGLSSAYASDGVIRNNRIEWAGNSVITGSRLNRMLIEGNQFLYGNWRRMNPNHEGGTSKWAFTLNSRIRNNETAHTYGYGLWTDIHNFGNVFENNVCHDNLMGAALFTEISSGDVFRDNVVFNNADGITIGESPNTLAIRNVIFNNNVGVRMRGNHRRNNAHVWTAANNGPQADTYERYEANIKAIPGITEMEIEQHMARYLLFWRAPKFHMSNNSYVESNLIFDNGTNYFEHRDYAKPSAIDPFINNFSDYNVWYHSDPAKNFAHAGGTYADFAAWQKASGRDEKSVHADPKDPATSLPDWAEKKRHFWEKKYRSPQEIRDLKLGTIESPMAAELIARVRRSAEVRPLKLADAQVKAFVIDIDGEPTLAVWTSQTADRRYVRVNVDASNVTIENGYGGRRDAATANGVVEVVANFVPTYVRGIGKGVVEAPGSTIAARSFNGPGQPVPVTATFVNDSSTAQRLNATFTATEDYRVEPATVNRTLLPGERAEVKLSALPGKPFVGAARVAVDATLGGERVLRSATFAVGEGGGKLLLADKPLTVDGDLGDWQPLGEGAQLGTIASADQLTRGDAKTWAGRDDASAKLHAVWTKDAIYMAAEVTDESVIGTAAGTPPYQNDAVEFFLDGRASDMQWQVPHTEGVYQIAVGSAADGDKPAVEVRTPAGSLTGLESAIRRTAAGYAIEIKIPLTPGNFPARDWNAGRTVKVSALLNDRDVPTGETENVLGWSFSPRGGIFNDTSGWKTLVLE
jgi:parallel beta-helix repeat protein